MMPWDVFDLLKPKTQQVTGTGHGLNKTSGMIPGRGPDPEGRKIGDPSKSIDAQVAEMRKDLAKMGDSMLHSIGTAVIDPLYHVVQSLDSKKNSSSYVDSCKNLAEKLLGLRNKIVGDANKKLPKEHDWVV